MVAFTTMPAKSRAVIRIMVELYRLDVGSAVPGGAISSSLARVTVLFSMRSSSCSMPAPNASRNVSGPNGIRNFANSPFQFELPERRGRQRTDHACDAPCRQKPAVYRADMVGSEQIRRICGD